jgi:hypothetical protein
VIMVPGTLELDMSAKRRTGERSAVEAPAPFRRAA